MSSDTVPAESIGATMHAWARDLFPICRSLTGPGTRQTLEYLQARAPEFQIKSVASGTKVFDWTVPNEWSVKQAYVLDASGRRVVDFDAHNLHLVGYSVPFRGKLTLEELQRHLFSLPDQPDAIPYVTSYYKPFWGFCMRHCDRERLVSGTYEVIVDTTLEPGVLNYAEAILPGREPAQVLVSSYVCHPSMGNNELSGPVVATALLRWLAARTDRRLTYRFVLIPETIGSLTYLSMHHAEMKRHTIAGFNLTCVGDERDISFLPSRLGGTLADRVALHVLTHAAAGFTRYSYLDRGSDERQYCSPGIDLPVVSIMRSKYGTYPEYHTSLDDLSLITSEGLQRTFDLHTQCIEALEANLTFTAACLGEPQLGKRGLYPTISQTGGAASAQLLLDVFTYCDGQHDLLAIAEIVKRPMAEVIPAARRLAEHRLIHYGPA